MRKIRTAYVFRATSPLLRDALVQSAKKNLVLYYGKRNNDDISYLSAALRAITSPI